MTFDLGYALAAVIAATPAILAARDARKAKRQTETRNGRRLGELVENLDQRVGRIERRLATPSGDPIGDVAERTHDLAAVTVAAVTEEGSSS